MPVTILTVTNCGEGAGAAHRAGSAPPDANITKKREKGTDTSAIGRVQNSYFLVLSITNDKISTISQHTFPDRFL